MANKIGDTDLLGLSKLQDVLQTLSADQARTTQSQEMQESQLSAAHAKLHHLEQGLQEVTVNLLPQMQRQIETLTGQAKAMDEAKRRLRDQEAQLAAQFGRLELLEKQVDSRMASLQDRFTQVEESEETRYQEVRSEMFTLRQDINAAGEAKEARLQAEEARLREEQARLQEKQQRAEALRLREEAQAAERERELQELEARLARQEEERQQQEEEEAARAAAEEQELLEATAAAAASAEAAAAAAAAVEASSIAAVEVAEEVTDEAPRTEVEPAAVKSAPSAGGRLKKLSQSEQKQHKLAKKKLKEIAELELLLNSKQLRYHKLTDDQKEKLKRKDDLMETVDSLEKKADELEQQESQEPEAAEEEQPVETPVEEVPAEAPEMEEEGEFVICGVVDEMVEGEEDAPAEEQEDAEEQEEEEAEAEDPAIVAARLAEEAAAARAAAHAAAVQALEMEKQELDASQLSWIKQKKTTLKKIKDISEIERKMMERGQTLADLLPEVQEKVNRKAELTKSVADLDKQLAQAETKAKQLEAKTRALEAGEGLEEPVHEAEVMAEENAEEADATAPPPVAEQEQQQPIAPEQPEVLEPAKIEETQEAPPAATAADPVEEDDDEDESKVPSGRTPPRPKNKAAAKAKKKPKAKSGEKKQDDSAEINALAATIDSGSQAPEKKKGFFGFLGM